MHDPDDPLHDTRQEERRQRHEDDPDDEIRDPWRRMTPYGDETTMPSRAEAERDDR